MQTTPPANKTEIHGQALEARLEALGDAESCCAEGEALLKQRRPQEALPFFRKAVSLDAGDAHGWFGQGMAYTLMEEYAESLQYFRKVIKIAPRLAIAHHNLGRCLHEIGRADQAYRSFKKAIDLNFSPTLKSVAVAVPGFPSASNRSVLRERRRWAQSLREAGDYRPLCGDVASAADKQRLDIGYVSAFFHRENWMKPVWGLVGQHDREQVRVHLFSDRAELTPEIGKFLDAGDRFHDMTGLGNEQAARLVFEQGIDILVDLNGYSYPPRLPLFLYKPAPRIVGWFNMYATTGFDCFDFLVGDDCVIPESEERFYSEDIVRVPGSYLTFNVAYEVPEVSELPSAGEGHVTFGSLISLYKITPGVIECWARILKKTPASRLLVRNAGLGKKSNRDFLLAEFEKRGVNGRRITLEGPAPHFEFLETYDRIDIALDAFPYNGGTTTTEALWQGVPVVAYWGDRWVSRTSATLLRAAGFGEWVANDRFGYVQLAVKLASDPQKLASLRRNMREKLLASKVCDTAAFAREMEKLYRRIRERG